MYLGAESIFKYGGIVVSGAAICLQIITAYNESSKKSTKQTKQTRLLQVKADILYRVHTQDCCGCFVYYFSIFFVVTGDIMVQHQVVQPTNVQDIQGCNSTQTTCQSRIPSAC